MYRPTSLNEAAEILGSNPEAVLLAGGTDLMVDINLKHARPATVVSLRRVPELAEMTSRFIGAGVTYAQLASSEHGALAEASRTVGSPQIRVRGTIGGNLGTASPAGDALPFLVAADAIVVVTSIEGHRRIPVDEFLIGPKQNALRAGEMIVGVELNDSVPRRQAFSKVGTRQAMVIAIASVCVLRRDDGTTSVALGSVGPTVFRAAEAEALVGVHELDDGVLDEFETLVSGASRPVTDHRATAAYRRHAVGVIARRALMRTVGS